MKNEDIALLYSGAVLRRYREKAGMSQELLSGLIGVSKTFYHLMEKTERKPNVNILIKLAKVLKIRPGELLDAIVEEAEAQSRGDDQKQPEKP